jgi:hypothetical protein
MTPVSEHTEQSRFFAILRKLEASRPELKWSFAIPNGFLDTKSKRIRAWREGVTSGVSDVFIPIPSRGHHGLFLEFKRQGGTATKDQLEFIATMASRGYKAQLVFSHLEALRVLKDYLEAPGGPTP